MGGLTDLFSLRTLLHLCVLRPVLKLGFGIDVEGAEHLRGLQRFIMVANHNSHLDALLLFQSLPWRMIGRTHPVAAHEYFSRSKALFAVVNFLLRPVWIVRGDTRRDPLAGMRERLQQGHSILIFPEGTRGEPGVLAPFHAGVGKLAAEFRDVPVVPAFLAGADRALPKSSRLPLPVCTRVVVGPPQVFSGSRKDITTALEGMVHQLGESEVGARHRRLQRPRQVPIIAVIGIDGSGKSTLARRLAQKLSSLGRTCLVSDDVEVYSGGERQALQPLISETLREAISRHAKRAGSLKSYKVPKLAELLLRDRVASQVRRWYAPDVIVMDGSPLLNTTGWARLYHGEAFDAGVCASVLALLSDDDADVSREDPVYATFPELAAWRRLHLPALLRPDVVLFLDVDPAVAMARIRSRGEAQQVHETEDQLLALREGYQIVCHVMGDVWGVPTEVLQGEGDIDTVTAAALLRLGSNETIAGLTHPTSTPGGDDDG